MIKPESQIASTTNKDQPQNVHFYPEQEERINITTHAIGFLASIVGAYLLLRKSPQIDIPKYFYSYVIYSLSLLILYAASTIYHSAKELRFRRRMNIVDHAAIYVLIAGTYTPFTIISLEGRTGWHAFIAIWSFAFVGIILKLFYTGKFDKLSTFMYIAMGWMVLFIIDPMIAALPSSALYLLFAGGVFYSVGALFYSIKSIKFNHAIFHLFVLAGSLSHYLSIYLYV